MRHYVHYVMYIGAIGVRCCFADHYLILKRTIAQHKYHLFIITPIKLVIFFFGITAATMSNIVKNLDKFGLRQHIKCYSIFDEPMYRRTTHYIENKNNILDALLFSDSMFINSRFTCIKFNIKDGDFKIIFGEYLEYLLRHSDQILSQNSNIHQIQFIARCDLCLGNVDLNENNCKLLKYGSKTQDYDIYAKEIVIQCDLKHQSLANIYYNIIDWFERIEYDFLNCFKHRERKIILKIKPN